MGEVEHFDGLVQDCSISIATTLEILQSCTKPLICEFVIVQYPWIEGSVWRGACG